MYADPHTGSRRNAPWAETDRRRASRVAYNEEHAINADNGEKERRLHPCRLTKAM